MCGERGRFRGGRFRGHPFKLVPIEWVSSICYLFDTGPIHTAGPLADATELKLFADLEGEYCRRLGARAYAVLKRALRD